MINTTETLEKLHLIDREDRHLERTSALLQWDAETYLPKDGVEERAEQMALLQGMAHERFTRDETGRLLADLGSDSQNPRGDEKLPALERDFLRVVRRKYDRAVKLPGDFVSNMARAEGLSQAAWAQARKDNNFAAFLPHLSAMVDFARKKSAYWGFGTAAVPSSLYDGLLDIFEPGLPAAEVQALFTPLRDRLSALIKKINASPQPDCVFLNQDFDIAAQTNFNNDVKTKLGFNANRGRLDISAHPFTTSLGADDIRITTRYFKDNLLSTIFSVIHESGHAFYEMGFPAELRGSSLADGASMAVHESQSRFWENVIGRSRPFWEFFLPLLKTYFPAELGKVSVENFYRAVNQVRPSLIRVDADEVSYSLHIILRFDLEQRLFSGALKPEDLPAAWNKGMKDYLGLEPPTDADGVLQDIHWSMGSFGYFPSYALGNLYGLQFRQKIMTDLPNLDDLILRGDFDPIHQWLRETIYRWGCRLEPSELLKTVTGEKLSAEPFLKYIEHKYDALYASSAL
ncbi:carboxypeptidase M32 [Spirochaetia bacterium]|nr:carboxypeptidase M32 [Spirochaetia bacterium]